MASLRDRRNFSSPSFEAVLQQEQLLPPPIPTGKGSRSAADPAFSEYIDSTKKLEQVRELILPDHVIRGYGPTVEIDYGLLMKGDDDMVQRLLMRLGEDSGVFRVIRHGLLCSEEVKLTLIENQRGFEKLSKSRRRFADREEFVWCPKIAEKAVTIFGDQNLHIFCQTMNKVAEKLEEIGKILASILIMHTRGRFNSSKTKQTHQLIIHRYHQTTYNGSVQIKLIFSSTHSSLRFHLLLPRYYPSDHDGGGGQFFPSSSRAAGGGKFMKDEPLFLIELQLQQSSSSSSSEDNNDNNNSNSATKRFTIADQILILLLLLILYNRFICFF